MAQFPMYKSNASINNQIVASQGSSINLQPIAGAISDVGKAQAQEEKQASNDWLKAQTISQTNTAYNDMEQTKTAILAEAATDKDFNNAQKYKDQMNELNNASSNIMDSNVKLAFSGTIKRNINDGNIKLDGLFRNKEIKYQQGQVVRSQDLLSNQFIVSGDQKAKEDYRAVLDANYKGGFITRPVYEKGIKDIGSWDYKYIVNKANSSPEEAEEAMNNGYDIQDPLDKKKALSYIASRKRAIAQEHSNNAFSAFYADPTEDGIKLIQATTPTLSQVKLDQLRETYEETPNYEATTTYRGIDQVKAEITKLSLMNDETQEEQNLILNKSIDIMTKIKRSNVGKGDKTATVNVDDVATASQLTSEMIKNKVFKKAFQETPDLGVFRSIMDGAGVLGARTIDQIAGKTSSDVLKLMMQGSKEEAKQVYENGMRDALKIKYDYIPEMHGTLTPNKTIMNINGKPYKFMGYGADDILVEVAQ